MNVIKLTLLILADIVSVTALASSDETSRLVFCGDNMVYMIDVGKTDDSGYENAAVWSFDSNSIASILGKTSTRGIDDCKPVENNSRLLVTSSQGWCVLLDIETKEPLFHTNASSDAHSAELLPKDRLVVACSSGSAATSNCLQLYDISSPGKILSQIELQAAHGVVWNDFTKRLYAIGGQTMLVISLTDWYTDSPSFTVERTISTPTSRLHDLTYVDSNTLCVAGVSAFLYNVVKDEWTELPMFSDKTSLKSVNYNSDTTEIWYTDATEPEGEYNWSTQTLRHATESTSSFDKTIKVRNINLYKVRIMNW